MASLRKSPNSKNWIICFRSHDGTQHQVSSKLPAKPAFRDQAMHIALELQNADRKTSSPDFDHFAQQTQFQKLSQKVMRIAPESIRQPSLTPLSELFGRWIENKKLSRSQSTYVRYKQVGQELVDFLGAARLKLPVSFVRPQDIEEFVHHLAHQGQTPSNCTTKLKIIRNLFQMGLRQSMIANNPACAIDAPSAIRNTREPFTIEELKALLIVSDQNWKVLILLGAYAGLRLGDACSLTWQNVDLDMRTITYLPKKKSRLPNVKKVVVPIHSDLYEAILKLPVTSNSPTTQLVSNLGSHATSGRNGLSMKFNRLMKMAGIDSLAIKAKGQRTFQAKTFHSLRHTFVSLMANSGVSQELRKELAGHDSDVHRIYSHHSIASFRGAIESMPSIVTK